MIKLKMKSFSTTLIERQQKFNKYEYLTGEEVLPSNKQQIIEQAKFEYSPLGKAFEKQVKTIEDQGKKQIEALENLKLKEITRDKTKPIEYNNYFIFY